MRNLDEPEAVVSGPLGDSNQVRLAGTVVTRHVLQPGWSWEEHAQPEVGTPSCELYHRGVVLSGRMGIRMDEGEELDPHEVYVHPSAKNTVFLASLTTGLWVSTDKGETFAPVAGNLPDAVPAITHAAVHPADPTHMMAVTDTGSMQPIPEAVAWSLRAEAWAQNEDQAVERSGSGTVSRWSDVAATGRPPVPADGVGWRTSTAEWRATSTRCQGVRLA